MKIKYALIAAALIAAVSTAAIAKDAPVAATEAKAPMMKNFGDIKAKKLQIVAGQIAKLEKKGDKADKVAALKTKQACIEAAADAAAMKACSFAQMKKAEKVEMKKEEKKEEKSAK